MVVQRRDGPRQLRDYDDDDDDDEFSGSDGQPCQCTSISQLADGSRVELGT